MERKQLEAAVVENAYLRGLFAIPAGGLVILAALGNWDLGPLRHPWVFGCCALVLAGTYLPIARYYNEHYGRATPSTRQNRRAAITLLVALPLIIGGSLLLSSRASWSLDLPVNPTAISCAFLMLMMYAMSVGLRMHHRIVFGALLLAGALPVWKHAGMSGNTGLLLAGVAIVVAGFLDHRMLVRTFGSSKGTGLEGGNAGA
jgi:hypothetical protein